MQPITAPIRPEERSANVANLQAAMRILGFPIDNAQELQDQRAGEATRRAVLLFMRQNNLRPTTSDALDSPVVDLINKLLNDRGLLDSPVGSARLIVHGTVRNALGQPQPGLMVSAFDVDLRNRERLGNVQTDADGQYEIVYSADQFKRAEKFSADLLLQVMEVTGAPRYESPQILFNAPALVTIDIDLDGGTYRGPSEYERLMQAIAPILGAIPPGDLQEDETHTEITFVASDAKLPYERIELLVSAHKLESQTRIPAPFFYGVLRRQPLPLVQALDLNFSRKPTADTNAAAALRQLLQMRLDYVENLFQSAVAQNITPALDEKALSQIREQFSQLQQSSSSTAPADPLRLNRSIGKLLTKRLNESTTEDGQITNMRLAGIALQQEEIRLRQLPRLSAEQQQQLNELGAARTTLRVTALTAGHPALLETLRSELGTLDARSIPALAAFTTSDWEQRIRKDPNWPQAAGLGAEANPSPEALTAYARRLERRTEFQFPTATIAARLSTDPAFTQGKAMSDLLNQHPDFDIKTTPIDALLTDKEVASDTAQALKRVQRVYRLTDSYQATSTLVNDGLHSAQSVYFSGKDAFVARYADHPDIGTKQAKRIYARAKQVYATGLKLFVDNHADLQAGVVQAVGQLTTAPASLEQFPNLKILFETTDQCACEHCRSVYSPAAYLVDCLRFLSERNSTNPAKSVKDILFERRPDIGFLDLTCANTNTALPYIDLVCEQLEAQIVPLIIGSLPAAISAQLTDGPVTPAVLAEFRLTPELQENVPILDDAIGQTVASGQMWIVRDRLHTYLLDATVHVGHLMITELPQTHLTTAELNANPEYVNPFAYKSLKEARYPIRLPFDLNTEEVNAYLPQLGMKRVEVMETFQPMNPVGSTPTAVDIAAAYFSINKAELAIITTKPVLDDIATYWTGNSGVDETVLISTLQPLPVFMERTGLTFPEGQQLISLPLINPTGVITIDSSAAECDTAQMKLTNLTAVRLGLIHRFVRLWRRVGWTMGELSRAITALDETALDITLLPKLKAMDELRATYSLSIDQLISLYADIPLTSDSVGSYSLYETLFLNRSVTNPVDKALGNVQGMKPLAGDHVGTLVAGLNVTEGNLPALGLSNSTVLSLANLSAAYRQVLLADVLNQSIADFQLLRALIPTDPFNLSANPACTQVFIQQVEQLLNAGYSLSALTYLLRNQDDVSQPVGLGETAISAFLTSLRASLRAVEAKQVIDTEISDTTGELTRPYLSKLPDYTEAKADKLLLAITGELPDPEHTTLLTELGATLNASFIPADFGPIIAPDEAGMASTRADRFKTVLQAISTYQVKQGVEKAIVQAFAGQLALDEKITVALLNTLQLDGISLLQQPELAILTATELSGIDKDTTAANFPKLHQLTRWLAKCALVITPYKLKLADVNYLLANGPVLNWLTFQALDAGTVTFEAWLAFDRAIQYRRLFPDTTEVSLFSLIGDHLISTPSQPDFLSKLATLTGWDADQLSQADAQLSLSFPNDYRSLLILDRLVACMRWLGKSGLTVAPTIQLIQPELTDAESQLIKRAVRSRYNDAQWLDLSKQLQDRVRGQKRDALVAFLVAKNPTLWRDANDLYAYFLVDVQMESVMPTSRLVQASGAVQLFVQRCLMNLEPEVRADDLAWAQWKWMKNYRVWEANRKIFLYPENWIEPELRRDKSVFFKELENDLLQNELNTDNAETAFLNYLDKLETVARLEIVGQFYEADTRLLHVIGRTYGTEPHQYFYRRWVEGAYWTPWEKIDVDITGDQLVPLVINNRLHLYWLVFTEVAADKVDKSVTIPNQTDQQNGKFTPDQNDLILKIQVATSEYKRGKWAPKKVSVDTVDTSPSTITVDRTKFNLIPADLTASIGRYLLIIKDNTINEDATNYGYIGTFDIIGCHGVPERLDENVMAFVELPMTARSQYVNTLLRETNGDGNLHFTKGLLPFTNWPILDKTPGTFRILAPDQLSQFDQFVQRLLTKIVNRFPQLNINNLSKSIYERPSFLLLTTASGLPFFYQDRTRTFFAIPELVTGTLDKMNQVVLKDRFFFTEWDEQLNKWFKSLDINQDWDDYLLDLWNNPAFEFARTQPDGATNEELQAKIAEIDKENYARWKDLSDKAIAAYWENPSAFQLLFTNFYHPHVCLLKKELYQGGVEGMMQRDVQLLSPGRYPDLKPLDFKTEYAPSTKPLPIVDNFDATAYPQEIIDFSANGSYASYNWELFFHAPLLIANQFSKNQQFEEAMRWYHLIFNPTLRASLPPAASEPIPQRYWQTKPFFQHLDPDYMNQRIDRILLQIDGHVKTADDQVSLWRNHPFEPHLIAQGRLVAYQQTVVMKYLDNLIAWGDQLFRQGTMESINEATQLYVMAAELLGPRPLQVPKNKPAVVENFNLLAGKIDSFGNALIDLENSIAVNATNVTETDTDGDLLPRFDLYFCLPPNDKILGYWDTIANRLFNLRNGKNIDGIDAIPALFAPPIDPAMLVRAAAAGLDIGSVLSELNAPLPYYRFGLMVQKAAELANEVKALGSALLSALEKRDAESMALLRSSLELTTLNAVRLIKERQIEEAKSSIDGIKRTRVLTETRLSYYKSLAKGSVAESLTNYEQKYLERTSDAQDHQQSAQELQLIGAVLGLIPTVELGASGFGGTPVADVGLGGVHLSSALRAASDAMSFLALMANNEAARAATWGGHARRWDDWQHQIALANKELEQIDKQIETAQIREKVAQQELLNHDLQIANAQKMDEQMRTKFTNKELYDWMVTQLSATYFQSYQLAFDVAKKAERCLRYELGLADSSYIQFGYWDSLKKGLLTGEKLHQDIKRMEIGYHDQNRREYEINKSVSLALLNPIALLSLQQTGECFIDLPETLFDMDFPGHYLRRIKSVGLSLPCVVGPYTSVNATLTLTKSSIRMKNTLLSGQYVRKTKSPDNQPDEDSRFRDSLGAVQSVAISTSQNDTGLFELNYRDERYLPFEGQGVISSWHLQLNQQFRQFDYTTIADVILHLRYTAREGGGQLKQEAGKRVSAVFADFKNQLALDKSQKGLFRLFSLRQDFPDQWHRFLFPANSTDPQQLTLDFTGRFPYFTTGHKIEYTAVELIAKANNPIGNLNFTPAGAEEINLTADGSGIYGTLPHYKTKENLTPGALTLWTLTRTVAPRLTTDDVSDIWLLIHYTILS